MALAAAVMVLATAFAAGDAQAEEVTRMAPVATMGELSGASASWLSSLGSVMAMGSLESEQASGAHAAEVAPFTLREIAVAAIVIAIAVIGALVGLAVYDSSDNRLKR